MAKIEQRETEELKEQFDAIVLTGGSEYPRDLPVEGSHLHQ